MKKLVALILALTMIVGLCACAKTGGDATKPTDNKSTTDTKPAGGNTDGKKPLNIMMYVIQSLGTLSCEDLIYEELTKFCEETGSTLNYYECNSDETKHDTTLPELCAGGEYDVIVSEGFSGNVLLKTVEGTGLLAGTLLRAAQDPAVDEAARALTDELNFSLRGASMFLGLKKPLFKAHGSATAQTVPNAVRRMLRFLQTDFISRAEAAFHA